MHVIGPGGSLGCGVTREVLNTALASLGRPALDDENGQLLGQAASVGYQGLARHVVGRG